MRKTPLASCALAAGLVLSACGGGDEPTTVGASAATADGAAGSNAAETAAANSDALQSTDDGRTTEVLDIADGSITTLQQAVTGDRPVLLWFWAPH